MRRRFPSAEIQVLYGPTEGTIICASHRVPRHEIPRSLLGRPLGNVELSLRDPEGGWVPIGAPGEIWIGGPGVTRGYLAREALTAERYPWIAGRRFYRTGDRARQTPEGCLEFLGRIDDQIKVRGFRIEPGEIEAVIQEHPGVSAVAVVAREDAATGRELIAWVVPASPAPAVAELRARVQTRLPDYMMPGRWAFLAELPLTAHGKVDRRALAGMSARAAEPETYVAPRTPVEEMVAGAFAEVLGVERVSAEASFFQLGGHSLLATQLLSRLRAALRVELPLRSVFEQPTVAGLAREVEVAAGSGAAAPPSIERIERTEEFPLSFAQQRLWFIHQLEPESPAHNMFVVLRLDGELDVSSLERALSEVVHRHESLRTRFPAVEGRPAQRIDPPRRQALPVIDLLALDLSARAGEAERLARGAADRPFDLASGPLLRTVLVRYATGAWHLLFTLHHIVGDGWSIGVLVREISALYRASSQGQSSALPKLPFQYVDFAVWQREGFTEEWIAAEVAYWRERLKGAPPVLDLPLDRARPSFPSSRGASRSLLLSPTLYAEVRSLSRKEGATLFMTLLAVFQALLSRLCNQEDVVVGTPVAGRNRLETEGIIGFFVNTLCMRGDLSGSPTFLDLLQSVRATTLDAYMHQELPFERLVEELAPERSLSHTPLFQVMFALQNAPSEPLALPGLRLTPVPDGRMAVEFDWTFDLTEEAGGISGTLLYRTDLFDGATLERVLRHFQILLERGVAEPGRLLAEIPLLSSVERHLLLAEWSRPAGELVASFYLDRFAARVARDPRAVAAVFAGEPLSYGELDRRTGHLASYLQSLGVGPEVTVGIFVDRSFEMLVGLLGVLRAGGIYVPLDPTYPRERLAFMQEDCGASVILTKEHLAPALPPGAARAVLLDKQWPEIERHPSTPAPCAAVADNGAYVIYTSGSTGRPKGALVTHRALAGFAMGYAERIGLRHDDRVLAVRRPQLRRRGRGDLPDTAGRCPSGASGCHRACHSARVPAGRRGGRGDDGRAADGFLARVGL